MKWKLEEPRKQRAGQTQEWRPSDKEHKVRHSAWAQDHCPRLGRPFPCSRRVLAPGSMSLSTCFTSCFSTHLHDPSTILASVLCMFLPKWSCPLPYCSHTLQDHTKCLLVTKSCNVSSLVSCTPLRKHHLLCASSHPLAPCLHSLWPTRTHPPWSYHFATFPHDLLPSPSSSHFHLPPDPAYTPGGHHITLLCFLQTCNLLIVTTWQIQNSGWVQHCASSLTWIRHMSFNHTSVNGHFILSYMFKSWRTYYLH